MTDTPPRVFQKVKIGGVDWDNSVVSLEVEDHDRLLDKATIVVRDSVGMNHEAIHLGNEVVIELGWESEHAKIFQGLVQRAPSVDGNTLTVIAYDMGSKMHVKASPKTHKGTLSAILKKIVSDSGIAIAQIEPDPDPDFKELVQGPVTDWQFIQMLAVRFRCRGFVETDVDQPKFYFISEQKLARQSPVTKLYACTGFGEVVNIDHQRVSTRALPYRVSAVIDPNDGSIVSKEAPPPAPPTPATPNAERQQKAQAMGLGDSAQAALDASAAASVDPTVGPQLAAAGLPSDSVLVDALARPDPTTIMGFRATATVSGNVKLRAKSKVAIDGISGSIDGDWYVRLARHMVSEGAYKTMLEMTR